MTYADKVATIVPKHHLVLTATDSLHMALSHCCVDSEYVQFYRDMVTLGHHVILDNSTIETGEPQDFESYLDAAGEIGASEIVLPDFFPDAPATIAAAVKSMRTVCDLGYKVMGIPQGATPDEWYKCAVRLLELGVDVIGISYRYEKHFGKSRSALVERIGDDVKMCNAVVHLLGCNSVAEVHRGLQLPYVRGVDSAIASLFAKHLVLWESYMDRPERDIDFLTDRYDEPLLKMNIDRWRRWCHGQK